MNNSEMHNLHIFLMLAEELYLDYPDLYDEFINSLRSVKEKSINERVLQQGEYSEFNLVPVDLDSFLNNLDCVLEENVIE